MFEHNDPSLASDAKQHRSSFFLRVRAQQHPDEKSSSESFLAPHDGVTRALVEIYASHWPRSTFLYKNELPRPMISRARLGKVRDQSLNVERVETTLDGFTT